MAVDNKLDLDDVDLTGVTIAADRGINQASLTIELVTRGAYISGTVPKGLKTKNPPFATFANHAAMKLPTATKGAHNILEHATRSAYWVSRQLPGNKFLYYLAVRQGHANKIAYLATSHPRLGPNTYCLERAVVHHQFFGLEFDGQGNILRLKDTEFSDEGCVNYFRDVKGVRFVTERQTDALWFLFRQFRFTSTTARKVFTALEIYEATLPQVEASESNQILSQLQVLNELLGLKKQPADHNVSDINLNFQNYEVLHVNELKNKCKELGISGYSKWNRAELLDNIKSKLDELTNLSAPDASKQNSDAVYKSFFKSWFMEPFKATPAMSVGVANEKPVLKGLAKFFWKMLMISNLLS